MIGKKKIVCVIPARLHSVRFPKKLLALLSGKPLIKWAWEGAMSIPFFDEVVIAVDSEELAFAVEGFGGKYHRTSVECQNGTARLVELQQRGLLEGDIWVNWQGDEPFLSKQVLIDLLQSCEEEQTDVWTLKERIFEKEKIQDPTICKVVCDAQGRALYFSRSPIPYARNYLGEVPFFRHIGLYAYSSLAIKKISSMPACPLELAESLEQLRFLFHGLKIQVHETKETTIGIDLQEHLILAEEHLRNLGKLKKIKGILMEGVLQS